MNRYLLPLIAASILASGCASTPDSKAAASETSTAQATVSAAQAEQAKAAIAAAEKSRDAAAAAGFEWRDTSKMIEEAKKAAAANEFDKAIALARQAEHQGNIAVKQSAIEAERVSKMK